MYRKFSTVILALALPVFSLAQQSTREQRIDELRTLSAELQELQGTANRLEVRRNDLVKEILAVDDADLAEAEKAGAKAARLFPAGVLRDLMPESNDLSTFALFSTFTLLEIGGYYSEIEIEYRENYLQFVRDSDGAGFIANLGGTLLGSINEQTPEYAALAGFEKPADPEKIRDEFSADGLTFRNKAAVVAGSTYLIRVFKLRGTDMIFALKVQRVDSDRSIVLFVRPIKDFSITGRDSPASREGLPDFLAQQNVLDALLQKGFYGVSVEATTTEVTLRGTIPKGKMAEAVQTAMETAKRKVNVQLIEQ